jgi:peroxiredoxin
MHLPTSPLSFAARWCMALLCLVVALSGCQRATPEPAYRYDDRDLFKALPQLQLAAGPDTLAVHAQPQAKADGSHLFLLLGEPSVPNNGDALLMQHLGSTHPSSAVWFIDTPDALFMERDRVAMRNHSGDFVAPLLAEAVKQFASITLITMDVASVPLLRGLRQWQTQASEAERAKLAHVVLLYPSLYVNTPVAGRERVLFPIARNTALPITVVQPELGAQANTIDETLAALREGGSLVRLERVAATTDGIYKYDNIRTMSAHTAQLLTDADKTMREERRSKGFQVAQLPPYDASTEPQSTIAAGLVPVEGLSLQDIRLKNIDGKEVDLKRDYAGKALLVTFWATWCPHCVEEIPSMNRALAQMDKERFAMVSVSYKDTDAIMNAFRKKVPMDFPVLMDRTGDVSKAWKVYAFPSSFLIDRSGRVRYSINTGAVWDAPDVLDKLREISQ